MIEDENTLEEYQKERDLLIKLIKKANEGNMKALYCLSEHYYGEMTRRNCADLIGTITDEEKLGEIVINASFNNNSWMSFAAMKYISNPAIFEGIALRLCKEYNHEGYNPSYDFTMDVRLRLIDKINNRAVLEQLLSDRNIEVHQKIQKKLRLDFSIV